jgi:hypothetical protein
MTVIKNLGRHNRHFSHPLHRAEFISGHGCSFLLIAEQEAIPAEQEAILMEMNYKAISCRF